MSRSAARRDANRQPNSTPNCGCDPPIDRVDAAAFAGRSLASQLHQTLMSAGVGCTRLAIHAVTANGEELSRVWRCAEPLTEDATADRVRWQLDGWLNSHRRAGAQRPGDRQGERPTAPVTMLRLQPVEVVSAEALQLPLWGGLGEEDRLRARRALVRVQGLLGPDAVQVPVLSGGRGPAERITLVPLGDEPVPRADPQQPWPGQLPEPSPAVLLDDPVELLDAQGNPVRVTSRGMFSADPARLEAHGPLRWWAGPWPVDERWWDPVGAPRLRGSRPHRPCAGAGGLRTRGAGVSAVLSAAALVPRGHLRVEPPRERADPVDEPVEERTGSTPTPTRALCARPQRPDQSAIVIPRVSVPVNSTSTVAVRVCASDGSSATAAASGSCRCAR